MSKKVWLPHQKSEAYFTGEAGRGCAQISQVIIDKVHRLVNLWRMKNGKTPLDWDNMAEFIAKAKRERRARGAKKAKETMMQRYGTLSRVHVKVIVPKEQEEPCEEVEPSCKL